LTKSCKASKRFIYFTTSVMIVRSIIFVVFDYLRIKNNFLVFKIFWYYIELFLCNTTEYVLVGVIMYSIRKMQ
jgi:hypothetical protein